jgi:hypothetical protein
MFLRQEKSIQSRLRDELREVNKSRLELMASNKKILRTLLRQAEESVEYAKHVEDEVKVVHNMHDSKPHISTKTPSSHALSSSQRAMALARQKKAKDNNIVHDHPFFYLTPAQVITAHYTYIFIYMHA